MGCVTLILSTTIANINYNNHNYNKILKSDWLSTALISALIGQFNWTVRAITRALKWLFFALLEKQILEFLVFLFKKRALYITNFVKV